MRVSRDQMAQHRRRIIEAASRAFRARGFERSGVADIMGDAGLTHGGFYGHFASKLDLEAEACAVAMATGAARWTTLIDESPEDALSSIIAGYLSERHRDSPATGCVIAALGSEVAREGADVRRAFTRGLSERLDLLAQVVTGRSKIARRNRAVATMAAMAGAVMLARAVDDPGLSDEILNATREAFSE